jgi:hypothetical protein
LKKPDNRQTYAHQQKENHRNFRVAKVIMNASARKKTDTSAQAAK